MARRATRGAHDPDAQTDALVRFVNGYLSYRVDVGIAGVLETLDNPIGDCTEFADLLTTLARASGLPARTVTGLAYAEQDGPGFYLHTWTEIAVDDVWRAVDPTFGNTRIGPTHVRFPMSPSGYLRAYAAIPDMRFEVIDAEYRASP